MKWLTLERVNYWEIGDFGFAVSREAIESRSRRGRAVARQVPEPGSGGRADFGGPRGIPFFSRATATHTHNLSRKQAQKNGQV